MRRAPSWWIDEGDAPVAAAVVAVEDSTDSEAPVSRRTERARRSGATCRAPTPPGGGQIRDAHRMQVRISGAGPFDRGHWCLRLPSVDRTTPEDLRSYPFHLRAVPIKELPGAEQKSSSPVDLRYGGQKAEEVLMEFGGSRKGRFHDFGRRKRKHSQAATWRVPSLWLAQASVESWPGGS